MDLEDLIQRHRQHGLLIDANLLVLYMIGTVNKSRITKFKRTEKYTARDFEALRSILAQFARVITTPHILTEVSNLARPLGKEQAAFSRAFSRWIDAADERFEASREIARQPLFARLGLTDAAVASATRKEMLVLTDDLDLYLALARAGADCINFSHIRPL